MSDGRIPEQGGDLGQHTTSRAGPRPTEGEPAMRRVGGFTIVPALIRQFGVDPAPILAVAGLNAADLDRASNRIPHEAAMRLLNEAAARTGCPHFGLLLGRAWHLSDTGVAGELMRDSPTVGQALNELVVYQHLNSDGALAFLLQRGGVADLGYAVYVACAESASQLYDAAIAVAVNLIRELCGDAWSPSEVFLAHSAPADVAPYRQHFRVPLRFDSEFCAIRFPSSWLAQPIEGADAQRLQLARARAEAADKAVFVQRVSRALRRLLLHGKSSGADVALALAMHRRTLNRRLGAEGTTFQQVLDRVRFAVAKELLEDSGVAMHDIAAALGYAGLAPFMRAFRRWTGTTPGAWRQSAR